MKKSYLLIVMISTVICFSGCKKIPVIPESKVKSLIEKKWKLTGFTVDGVDMLDEFYDACELDDIQIFKAGGKLIVDEGDTKCDDTDPQLTTGTWEIKGNELIFLKDNSPLEIKCDIIEITAKNLKYSFINPFGAELYSYTFTAQ